MDELKKKINAINSDIVVLKKKNNCLLYSDIDILNNEKHHLELLLNSYNVDKLSLYGDTIDIMNCYYWSTDNDKSFTNNELLLKYLKIWDNYDADNTNIVNNDINECFYCGNPIIYKINTNYTCHNCGNIITDFINVDKKNMWISDYDIKIKVNLYKRK